LCFGLYLDLQKKDVTKKTSKMPGREFLLAARDGDTATIRTLLSTAGAQSLINYQDANGATPVFCAAENRHASVTEQLIGARCDTDAQTLTGATPLSIAAQNGHASVTKQLIEARCKIDLEDENGYSRSTPGPKMGMLPSRSCFLQRAVSLVSRRRTALLRCN
jgi:ankyrin repeat protein